MLKSHIDQSERVLLAQSKIPANSGHPLHKGTPRESFIKIFLKNHLPSTIEIGSGEIIDSNSKPNEQRNQHDIVLYKKNYPKISFDENISGFFIESVISTIEIKSTLTKEELKKAILSAKNTKSKSSSLVTTFRAGYIPPKPLNYIVSYDGPKHMSTIISWIDDIYKDLNIEIKKIPLSPEERITFISESIDGIFILGKGFIYFNNVPGAYFNEAEFISSNQRILPHWIYSDGEDGNLLLLFLLLTSSTQNIDASWINTAPYLSNHSRKITYISYNTNQNEISNETWTFTMN